MIFEKATIITMNPQRQIIKMGSVVVDGTNIIEVGKTNEISEKYPDKRRIDCNGNVIMPGLIDSHVHTAQAMIRGSADDLGLIGL